MNVSLHLYYSPYCPQCRGVAAVVDEVVRSLGLEAAVEERNVVDNIDAAVAAGVRQTPALTVNGRLLASGRMDAEELKRRLEQKLAEEGR